jgi:hypothetical protein
MPTPVAELIDEKTDALINYIGSPVDPVNTELPLDEQAKKLIESDKGILVRLGKDFQIPKQDEMEPHLRDARFNFFLAEPLLREGSLLLDRCLQQRREYDDLSTKLFEAGIQIFELFQLNQIAKAEEDDYEKLIKLAQNDRDAINKENVQLAVLRDLYAGINNLTYEASRGVAKDAKALSDKKEQQDYYMNKDITDFELSGRQASASTQQQEVLIQTNTIKAAGAHVNVDLRTSQVAHQIERNDVARIIALRRAEQIKIEGGALNFLDQMKSIKDRFDNDLIAAWLRLSSAMKGFYELYQRPYPQGLPKDLYDVAVDFDRLVTWCQYTNTWLASFVDTQQQVTRSFSLRELVGKDEFETGLGLSRWKVKLTEDDFYNRKNVRMRGLAVQIDSGQNSGSWNVKITPPPLAKNNPKDQEHIGTLFLGRVSERTYAVVSESAAPPQLYNASPIGDDATVGGWVIEVFKGSTLGISASRIIDIDIHLTVALV